MDLICEPLENRFLRLEPLIAAHREHLRNAAHSGLNWDYMPIQATEKAFDLWFDWSCQVNDAGKEHVYAVRRLSDDGLVGSTRFLNIESAHKRCEIGHTWYTPDAQGTRVNPSAKYLLFAQAFAAGAGRVELKCDARNARSRAAITKLGAIEEGTLRKHMVLRNGYVRDTVYFSVIAEDWPKVRSGLEARLELSPSNP